MCFTRVGSALPRNIRQGVFVPGKPFQPSQMFVGKAYPRVEHLKFASLGKALALL
jgi:hypothetical protein